MAYCNTLISTAAPSCRRPIVLVMTEVFRDIMKKPLPTLTVALVNHKLNPAPELYPHKLSISWQKLEAQLDQSPLNY